MLSHFLTRPALIWDVLLNMTKVELELILDAEMYLFFEKGMLCRVFHTSKRYNKTKDKYLNSYDPKQESKHVIDLDASNLYGYVMSKFFLRSGFKWIDPLILINTAGIVQKVAF